MKEQHCQHWNNRHSQSAYGIREEWKNLTNKPQATNSEAFPNSYSFISSFKPLHSPLAKSPIKVTRVATREGCNIISKTTLKVYLFVTFLNTSSVMESHSPYHVDAPTVHMNPITYFFFEIFVEFESSWSSDDDSFLNTMRVKEMVRRTRELII